MISFSAKPYDFRFEPSKCALLMIDYQGDFLCPGGLAEAQGLPFQKLQHVIPPAQQVLEAARKAGIQVIHTREGHSANLSDLTTSKRTRQAEAFKSGDAGAIGSIGPAGHKMLIRGEKLHDIVDELKPVIGEIVIDKPGAGAFYNTELHQLLINRQISHLFVGGVTTEVCVSATMKEANDRGITCCVITDIIAGYVPSLEAAAIESFSYAGGLFGFSSTSDQLLPALATVSAGLPSGATWDGSLDVTTLRTLYQASSLTPEMVVKEVYRRIALPSADPAAWILLFKEEDVLRAARDLLAKYPDPTSRPPLFGIPYSIKDSIDYAGVPTTGACPAFAYTPKAHAPVIEMLENAGALAIGKTNLDQLATGLVGMRSPYGQPASVFSAKHVSGGSSSGSCVTVASRQISFSMGTDTAGSGRVPAAMNNIIGFKPTRGTVNAAGVIPCCLSLDCMAIEALSIADSRLVWDVLYGIDRDEEFSKVSRPPWALSPRAILNPGEAFAFAVPSPESASYGYLTPEFASLFESAVAKLASIGGQNVTSVDYTVFEDAGKLLYEGSFVAERVSGVREWYDQHPKPATGQDVLLPATRTIYDNALNSFKGADAWSDLRKQMKSQRLMSREFDKGFQVLVVPTIPFHPSKDEYNTDPIGLNHRLGKFTHFANILDMVGVSVPAGFTSGGMPFAVTFLGQSMTDGLVLEVAQRFEQATGIRSGAPTKA